MGYYGCDADTVFSLLRRWSATRNVKVRAIAASVVAEASRPSPRPFGALQQFLDTAGLHRC